MIGFFAAMLLATALAVCPTDAQDGWNVDFNDGATGGAITMFVKRNTGETQNGRLIAKIEDGVLTLGGKFDAESGDYVAIEWRDVGRVSIKDLPVLEIRCWIPKDATMLVMPTYSFEDGSSNTPYFSFDPQKPDGWQTMSIRLAGDSSLPKKWTPRRLIGVHLRLPARPPAQEGVTASDPGGERRLKLDWIKMRPFTSDEQKREDEWIAMMKDYRPKAPKSAFEFFPFGVYGFHYSRYGDETNYSDISRRRLNFAMDIVPKDPQRIFSIAEEMGVKIGLRTRMAEAIYGRDGADATRTQMRPLIEQAAKSKAVFGYDVGDEPSLDRLHSISAAKRIIEELDPTRPSWINFWDLSVLKSYTPYFSYFSTDLYPMATSNSGIVEEAFSQCRQAARENENKPQMIIVQAFGMRGWIKGGYWVPKPEEVRLQTWAAIAGGASGIVYYCYDSYYPAHYLYTTMIDPFGNPHPNYEEITRLGEKIVPLGYPYRA